jgi:hypothetical protein
MKKVKLLFRPVALQTMYHSYNRLITELTKMIVTHRAIQQSNLFIKVTQGNLKMYPLYTG